MSSSLDAIAVREPWPPVLFASTGLYAELRLCMYTQQLFIQTRLNASYRIRHEIWRTSDVTTPPVLLPRLRRQSGRRRYVIAKVLPRLAPGVYNSAFCEDNGIQSDKKNHTTDFVFCSFGDLSDQRGPRRVYVSPINATLPTRGVTVQKEDTCRMGAWIKAFFGAFSLSRCQFMTAGHHRYAANGVTVKEGWIGFWT
jgi:hypothetical protein